MFVTTGKWSTSSIRTVARFGRLDVAVITE